MFFCAHKPHATPEGNKRWSDEAEVRGARRYNASHRGHLVTCSRGPDLAEGFGDVRLHLPVHRPPDFQAVVVGL